MKTSKMNFFKALLSIITFILVLSACTQASNNPDTQSVDKPVAAPSVDIHTAVLSGNIDAVKQHIKSGTDINMKEPMSGSTPLISAATFGKTEIAKILVDAGANLALKNNDGATALHTAAFFGRIEIVQVLIDAKADKSLRNNYGATPRESVIAPFEEVKPIYEMLQQQLAPLGLKLDFEELQKSRPVIAMMLQ
ncbi:ankyrin repeat domain-containing protein [Chondrinema litorale]|uniref:ankyrin repeat domain-containing protein n=1 Tax=Chondrinema litorale TaxID=2994555 RepID=UPI002543A9B0|nr:ankyrin repeat domain-containing protein [Chondrinema litorale]UZR97719.1 ankyrin repeat domain-containing protein [Chondrinema litorale]